MPATQIVQPDDPAPLDAAIAAILAGSATHPAFDWIAFTSTHAVSAFMGRLLSTYGSKADPPDSSETRRTSHTLALKLIAGIRLAVVGPATAEALTQYGLAADLVPDRAAGRHLAAAFGDVAGLRILLPRSDVALRDLPDALRARGADVTEVVAYTTQPALATEAAVEAVLGRELDVVTFFSPSAVSGLATQVAPVELADVLRGIPVICVGSTTAQAARDKGLGEVFVAEEASVAGVVQTLAKWRSGFEGATSAGSS